MHQLLKRRKARFSKLSRAVLRYIRLYGFDNRACYLRSRLEAAVARVTELADCSMTDAEILDEIVRVRVAYVGITDQINAMAFKTVKL